MRVSTTLAILVLVALAESSPAEDLYWEGDNDLDNEFLEVDGSDIGISSHLQRLKRQTDSFSRGDNDDKISRDDDIDGTEDIEVEGSGASDKTEPESKEKAFLITFVVSEPYQDKYSDINSAVFKTFRTKIADAVNAVYANEPGIHRVTLIRIQSRPVDEFSCKVTLEIVTSSYVNNDKIRSILYEHIRNKRRLGDYTVNDDDFGFSEDPEIDDNDEQNLDVDDEDEESIPPEEHSRTLLPGSSLDPNTYNEVYGSQDNIGESDANTVTDNPEGNVPQTTTCSDREFRCDETRCIAHSNRCDGVRDCSDGTDEDNCNRENCGADDFICDNGKCIDGSRRCDRIADCENEEDERSCDCTANEFTCVSDGSCIEIRKQCDGVNNCKDGSDENDCVAGYFKCRAGKLIPEYQRCDRRYDCDPGDYSDEQNCPCGDGDFKCGNGYCIPSSKKCDRTHDCQDGSDERECVYGTVCMAYQYKCTSGQCVPAESRCNGTRECSDDSDELNCPCKRGEFKCHDGSCINIAKRCNGRADCSSAEDEINCGTLCPADSFTCDPGSAVPCAKRCDGIQECSTGEDEDGCDGGDECNHFCDGRCIEDSRICDQTPDCRDGSDEYDCSNCNGPDDFRCNNAECINADLRCNGVSECADASDELNCNNTQTPAPDGCNEFQFQCQSGECINLNFVCDRNSDCIDNSDEENCPCDEGFFQCVSGQCIPSSDYCNGYPDCTDSTDETECPTTFRPLKTALPPIPSTTYRPYFPTLSSPSVAPDYNTPVALNLRVIPEEQAARYGGDVVFACRDEGPQRAPVRWIREGGRPLKAGATDRKGRLEMEKVTTADSGVYICQAPSYLNYPGSEIRVTLTVSRPDTTIRPPFSPCLWNQATCGNGQCIPKSAVCDGNFDCSDRSDEESCNIGGKCEPNQFQCANRKCVLKTWLCDSDDDCGDGSDEQNCIVGSNQSQQCLPVEFACKSNDQCIPKSFHCDGQSDCQDKSDELGCAGVHVTKPPSPRNVKLNPGETLVLVCEAVGIPIPLISWRLNWGNVPPKCISTSVDGYGTLTCRDMQPEDSGAYSCEAINNLGTVFAVYDSIVYVNRTAGVCPGGYFNSEARSESECIRCFCFGKSTQCQSADLFIFNLPSPLGEGGTRLVGVNQAPDGDIQVDKSQSITNQYYYLPLKNGATVTKLMDYNSAWSRSTAHPYLTLPETYNGNQLTSYGGHIKYRLSPHNPTRYRTEDGLPDIIIKGTFQTLVYKGETDRSQDWYVDARLTPNDWKKPTPRGLVPASREDIMMALDEVELILLRAEFNNAGVNISEFNMESAQSNNVGLGAASLVEECTCPEGYKGRSCEKCADGYERQNSGPWDGTCVKKAPCPPMTYGDPNSGGDCKPCPCPLTNRDNQFASGCSIGPRGDVICNCYPGYEGPDCSWCASGYVGNPLSIGDSCRPQPSNNCNPIGTSQVRPPDECVCKENVQGRYCDQCRNGSYYLSNDFRHGCALCFCSGVSQQCMISQLRRRTNRVQFNTPNIVDQVKVYSSAPVGPAGEVRYNAPKETDLQPFLVSRGVSIRDYDLSQPSILYWSLPISFSGDKVTSYGGYLIYELQNVQQSYGGIKNNAADVQLISDNSLTFHYFGNFAPASAGYLNASVQFLEKGWQRPDGKPVSREHFLLALADVKAILVKATYSMNTDVASIVSASIETADDNADGPLAQHVEKCVCPTGYIGTSCEDCAPGYTRSSSGLYLELCGLCDCNGHSNKCHPETGVCFECDDNTDGPNCERCKDGYERDQYNRCVYISSTRAPTCNCDSRGEARPCSMGQCYCKLNVEGQGCDRCRPGTFGLDGNNDLGCTACYCSGVTNDCHEANHYSRIPLPAPIFGDDFGGYTIMDLNAERVINDQFMPSPKESELTYIIGNAQIGELYWSLPVFPGNRVLSYGGFLSLTQKFDAGGYPDESQPGMDVVLVGDGISIFWSNPYIIRAGEALSYQVPLREADWQLLNSPNAASRDDFMSVLRNLKRVLVRAILSPNAISTSIADVSMDTAAERYDSSFPAATGVEICMCPPGYSGTSCESCATGFYKDQSGRCSQCNCNGHDCQLDSYGEVKCNCRPPYTGNDCSIVGGEPIDTTTARPEPPPQNTIVVRITSPTIKIQKVGSTVNFTCEAQSRITPERLQVKWYKADGYLPQDRSQVDQRSGLLLITNLQVSDSGKYICETSDGMSTGQAFATLKVPVNDMTLPTVSISPSLKEYYEGDRIELTCATSGNPAPTVAWQRSSNRPLPRSTETYNALLIIDNAVVEDSGEYRCIASNTAGSAYRTAIVKVRRRPTGPVRERLTVSLSEPTINEGNSIQVSCTGTANIPVEAIEWIRQDGVDFLPNARSQNGVLYIENAVLENQGIYMCQTAPNFDVRAEMVVLTVISKNTPSPGETSNITVSVDYLKIPTGGSGSIECLPHGYPLPQIKWTKHQGSFGPGTSQRENTLMISNAQSNDTGYYLCEGIIDSRLNPSIYVYVEIERREKPSVQIFPRTENWVTLGTQYELHCSVEGGIPEPAVTWSRNDGRPLSQHVQILQNNRLRFQTVEVNDEGEYSCTAANDAGSVSASALIKVQSPPVITILPKQYFEVVIGDPVEVQCRASGYPEPVVSIKSDRNVVVPPTPRSATLTISRASEDGEYTCTATSAAGTSEERFLIRVDRGDGGYPDGSGNPDYDSGMDDYPPSMLVIEGQQSRITCNASDDFDVQWRREQNQTLQSNARQNGNELIIYNTSKGDTGIYECILINRRTGEVQQSALTSLQVLSPPRIRLQPPTQTVHPGQSPTVECIVEGDDIQTVTWKPVNTLSRRVEILGNALVFRQIEVEDAGKYECFASNRVANATAVAEVIVNGVRDESLPLVEIQQPRKAYRVGEKVEVLCKAISRDIKVKWQRPGTNLFVDYRVYGDGAVLQISGVQPADAAIYRCIGEDRYGRTSYNDFNLEIIPGSSEPQYPINVSGTTYTARAGGTVDLPCVHNLEEPATIEWRRENAQLAPGFRQNERDLHLESITEADAGIYVCRVSNNRASVETRATLRVIGVVPKFNGNGWLTLPTLNDAYTRFDIEVSFKPADYNGIILYNSETDEGTGDYIILQLVNGVPEFTLKADASSPLIVTGDRPLQLNAWHTIRLSRTEAKITMDVDNIGPFVAESSNPYVVLDLQSDLYIGGAPSQRPPELINTSGFIGCISMLILGKEDKKIMTDSLQKYNVMDCDICSPNFCQNNGICQEARIERGYTCICPTGYAGLNCDRPGEACRPGLCGPGKCTDTVDGFKCTCPITYTGKNCEQKQNIEYPAFTGSAYLAIQAPNSSRILRMSMSIKPKAPVTDGIIMYCAQSPRGYGGFASLAVRNRHLEFRFDLGDGNPPTVLTTSNSLLPNEWTSVQIARLGVDVSLQVDHNTYRAKLASPRELKFETPMFVGGVDDDNTTGVILNSNVGVTGGFSGCIKDVIFPQGSLNLINASIQSANVQECAHTRGDIPDSTVCSNCRNGGYCTSPDLTSCTCPRGYMGIYCELVVPAPTGQRPYVDPCVARPCKNGGLCKVDWGSRMNYSCNCPLGFGGLNCQMMLTLYQSVGLAGNGYLELPSKYLLYDQLETGPEIIAMAFHTTQDGVLLYQKEALLSYGGDYLLIKIEGGVVVMEWDFGLGRDMISVDRVLVNDGERHQLIAKIFRDGQVELNVDNIPEEKFNSGISSEMNADSNIYIGGIPDSLNVDLQLPGLTGCIEHVEFPNIIHGAIELGDSAVAGRNTQLCKEPPRRY